MQVLHVIWNLFWCEISYPTFISSFLDKATISKVTLTVQMSNYQNRLWTCSFLFFLPEICSKLLCS